MDIASFEVSPDKRVTVHMIQMPPEVRTTNTTMYVGATPVGQPDEVSFGLQTIVFSATMITQSGKIGVIVMLDDDQLDAQSAEDYVYVPDIHADTKPSLTSVNPPTASSRATVTLRGKNLGAVAVVSFTFSFGEQNRSYTSTQLRKTPDGTTVACTLPEMFKGVYRIGLGVAGGDRIVTPQRLTID
jgi:hypothetical protein